MPCVATSPVALRWLCDSPRTGCTRRTNIYVWLEQAIVEWSRRVISIVACCHGAKLCALAARDFRSQHLASKWRRKNDRRFSLFLKNMLQFHWRRKGRGWPWPHSEFWKFQQKKVGFLVSRRKTQTSPLLDKWTNGPLWIKSFRCPVQFA